MKKRIGFIARLTMFWLTAVVSAETVLIHPPEITSPEVGQTLTLEIRIEGAQGLFGFEFDLSYNPEFLKFVGATEGAFLQSAGQTFPVSPLVFGSKPKDGGTGAIRMGVSRLGGTGVNGNGVLAQVEFEVIKSVSIPILLEFQKVSLFDTQANKKAPETTKGSKITPDQNLTPWDVNSDGLVNIFDLVQVASQFGQSGDSLTGDVNDDRVVNVFDLVTVGSHFGESAVAAAPSLHFRQNVSLPVPLVSQIRRDLAELEAIPHPSRGVEIVIQFLRVWVADAEEVVTETRLRQNYPNPFNPETWIPYDLAQAGEVSIVIYDARGRRVRQLDLGHQPVGHYVSRQRAAYWDGKNEKGEKVSSGLYFYRLQVGNYAAVRKMIIVQ